MKNKEAAEKHGFSELFFKKKKKATEKHGFSELFSKNKKKATEKHGFSELFSKNKKKAAEINQQVIITVLSLILFILLLIFLMRACDKIKEKNRQIVLDDLGLGMRTTIDLLSSKDGAIKTNQFIVPDGTDLVCFLDLNKSDILKNTSLAREYPIINQSLNFKDNKNVFLIKQNKVTDAIDGGKICFDNYPYYSCIPVHDNLLDIWFEGKAGCTTIYINWSAFPKNRKNMSFYNRTLFLLQEKMSSSLPGANVSNWREISSVVPLSLFIQDSALYKYQYTIAYKPVGSLTFTEIKKIMDNQTLNTTYLFDTTYSDIYSSPGYIIIPKSSNNPAEYLGFWENYSSFIFVDKNNRYSALIASLLAAYVNTPIVFIDKTNLDNYKSLIIGKQIFIIAHGPKDLDSETLSWVRSYASHYYIYSDTLLQSEGTIPAFARLYSNANIG